MGELITTGQAPVRADLWPHPVTAAGRVCAEAWVPDEGAPLTDVLAALGPPPAGPLIVTVNGLPVPPGAWAAYIVRPGDLVLCRARLQGGDTNPLQIVLMIGVLALGGWAGAAIGGWQGALVAGAIVTVGGLLVNALFPVSLPDDPAKPKPAYSLAGGANRARPYEPVLMVLGTHRVFPDIAGAPYVEFIGGEQYLHQVFDFGVGDLDITEIKIGDTPLGSFNRPAESSADTVTHRVPGFGGPVYTRYEGYEGADALADVEQQLALPGEPITLVAEDVDTITGADLEDQQYHERTSAVRAVKLGFDFAGRLFGIGKKGDYYPREIDVTIDIRRRGERAWTSEIRTIRHASPDPVRITHTIDLPAPAGQWEVRVKRGPEKLGGDNTSDDLTWTAMRTYQDSTANPAGRTRLALRIRATSQLSGRLERVNAMVSARVKTWDHDAQTWTEAAASSNPGDILRYFAEGVRDGAGRLIAGAGLPLATRIDLASIQAWREWCDAENLALNYVIDSPAGLEEILQLITRVGRANHSWHTGKLGVVYDRANRPPTTLITAGNILAGSMRVDWADGRLADEIVAEYVDPDFDWQPAPLRRKVAGVVHPQRTARIRLPGVTNRAQAVEEVNLVAAGQQYHRRRMTWAMPLEGFALLRGQTTYLSEALVSGGEVGRLHGGTAAAPVLSEPVTITAGDDYLLLRLADGTLHTSIITHPDGGAGETAAPVLQTPLQGAPDNGGLVAKADPGVGAQDVLWRFYSAANPPLKVKVTGLRPLDEDTVEIRAIDEVAAYYAAKDLPLDSPLPTVHTRGPRVLGIQVAETLVAAGAGWQVHLVADLTVEGDWRGGIVTAALDDAAPTTVATLGPNDLRAEWLVDAESGTLTITAVPGSDVAPTGPRYTVEHVIIGDTLAPDDPTSLTVTALAGGYQLGWDAPEETDYAVTEVLDAPDSVTDIENATLRGEVAATVFARLDVGAPADLRVWVRHRDRTGNVSEAASVLVTTLAEAEGTDGPPGLPGASKLIPYHYATRLRVQGKGQYKFVAFDDPHASARLTVAGVKTATFLQVYETDTDGVDRSDFYDGVVAGDIVVWYKGNDFWLALVITSKSKSGDVYSFGIDFSRSVETAAESVISGAITFRWSRASSGEDGFDGQPGFMGVGEVVVYDTNTAAVPVNPGEWRIRRRPPGEVIRSVTAWDEVIQATEIYVNNLDKNDVDVERKLVAQAVDDLIAVYVSPLQWADFTITNIIDAASHLHYTVEPFEHRSPAAPVDLPAAGDVKIMLSRQESAALSPLDVTFSLVPGFESFYALWRYLGEGTVENQRLEYRLLDANAWTTRNIADDDVRSVAIDDLTGNTYIARMGYEIEELDNDLVYYTESRLITPVDNFRAKFVADIIIGQSFFTDPPKTDGTGYLLGFYLVPSDNDPAVSGLAYNADFGSINIIRADRNFDVVAFFSFATTRHQLRLITRITPGISISQQYRQVRLTKGSDVRILAETSAGQTNDYEFPGSNTDFNRNVFTLASDYWSPADIGSTVRIEVND